jgi:hypothetical protein
MPWQAAAASVAHSGDLDDGGARPTAVGTDGGGVVATVFGWQSILNFVIFSRITWPFILPFHILLNSKLCVVFLSAIALATHIVPLKKKHFNVCTFFQ